MHTQAKSCTLSRTHERYAYGLADDYQRHGKLGTADNHRIVLRKLEAYLKKTQRRRTPPFEDLTPELLRRFQSFLATEYGNSQNTIAKNLKDIRASVYTAIREGKLDQGRNPFFHIKIKEERTRKKALTLNYAFWRRSSSNGVGTAGPNRYASRVPDGGTEAARLCKAASRLD